MLAVSELARVWCILQVKAKYNMTMANLFRETFCWLPLAHCLNGRVLVVHGGLFSKDGVTLDDIRAIDRYRCLPSLRPFSTFNLPGHWDPFSFPDESAVRARLLEWSSMWLMLMLLLRRRDAFCLRWLFRNVDSPSEASTPCCCFTPQKHAGSSHPFDVHTSLVWRWLSRLTSEALSWVMVGQSQCSYLRVGLWCCAGSRRRRG